MKKIVLVIVIIIGALKSNGQELGLRFGDAVGGNVAIDGVFTLGEFSRVHADVSFGHGGLGIEALWDFIHKPLGTTPGLTWYAGAGPFLWIDDPFWFGVSGEIGIEYKFDGAPIVLGLDWRPSVSIIDETDFWGDKFGLNVRYVFGQQ
jgi:hypothetical protein